MSLAMTPQAKLRDLENDWLVAERAVLDHPEYPPCMLATARKAVKRLEEAKCPGPKQMSMLSAED